MRVGVTISRTWTDHETVVQVLHGMFGRVTPGDTITLIHGASGMDWFAAGVGCTLGMALEGHPATWRPDGRFHRGAGFARNQQMVDRGADLWLAFIARCDDPKCRQPGPHGTHGATDCADRAERAGIEVRRIREVRRSD